MPTITQLAEQGRALSEDQKSLVLDESRTWSEKRDEYDRREADIKSVYEQLQALQTIDGRSFGAVEGAVPQARTPEVAKSLGEQIVESDGYKSVAGKSGKFSSGSIDIKATLTESAGGAGGLIPQYLPTPVQLLFRRLVVADLLPSGAISGSSLIYVKESAVTNAAATVAEGGAKPGSDLNLVQVTENIRKIATSLKVTDEMFQDVPALMSYVNARLALFVQLTEESQLLNGDGTGTNLLGLNNRTGKQTAVAVGATPTETKRFDSIYNMITAIRTNSFLEPDGIIINPVDWQTLRLNKDANNQYFAGGPFTGAYGSGGQAPNSVWGLNAVITPAQAAGTALVGAFGAAAQVFRKGGLTVESTNSNEDDFLKNLVAVRAEERLLLAVYRPGALGQVTGL
jgi:HK97 family phage major capsid protein